MTGFNTNWKAEQPRPLAHFIEKYRVGIRNLHFHKLKLSEVLIAVNFNHPHYENIEILEIFYEPIFAKRIYCGPEPNEKYNITVISHPKGQYGWYGFECLGAAIRQHPDYRGYLYANDDMVVNWWNFIELDTNKVWDGKRADLGKAAEMGKPPPCCWSWWRLKHNFLKRCEEALKEAESKKSELKLQRHFEAYFHNTKGKYLCPNVWSDLFYIPGRFSQAFSSLSAIFFKHKSFLETSSATILTMMDKQENRLNLDGLYMPDKFGFENFDSGVRFAEAYSLRQMFIHPVKIAKAQLIRNLFKNVLTVYGKLYLNMKMKVKEENGAVRT